MQFVSMDLILLNLDLQKYYIARNNTLALAKSIRVPNTEIHSKFHEIFFYYPRSNEDCFWKSLTIDLI